jgi:hypothetical protein
MSAAQSTRGDAAKRIARHAARSNIHGGSSSQRADASPSGLQRRILPARCSITSWT